MAQRRSAPLLDASHAVVMDERKTLRIALTLSLLKPDTVIAFNETVGSPIGAEHGSPRAIDDWNELIEMMRAAKRRVVIDPRYVDEVVSLLNGDGMPVGPKHT